MYMIIRFCLSIIPAWKWIYLMDTGAHLPEGTTVFTHLTINNLETAGEGDTITVVNPATEAVVAEFRGASVAQVDAAVQAAKAAFEGSTWRDPAFRRKVLLKFADLLMENREQLMD